MSADLVTRGSAEESFEEHEARERAVDDAGGTPPPPDGSPRADSPPPESAAESAEVAEKADRGRRAHSQDASPKDVPRIRQLTAQKHEERQLREAAEARIAALEAKIEELSKAQPKAGQQPVEPVEQSPSLGQEPSLDRFAAEGKTYEDWIKAWNRWDRAREKADADAAAEKIKAATADQRQLDKINTEYRAREATFIDSHPDFREVIKAQANVTIPALLNAAILLDDRGPEFVYHLAQQTRDLSEMILLTGQQPVTHDSVALVRRLLADRLDAARTGSASTAPTRRAFSPPNPVRTGSQTPAASSPDDSESYEAHEARENARDRERRRSR
jgi:hypothetical protein